MAIKDANLFEKHAEKIVLGAAAAGAVFMGYLAIQSVSIDGDIGPKDVQKSVHEVLGDPLPPGSPPAHPRTSGAYTLEDSRREIEDLGKPRVIIPDNVQRYEAMARQRPLDTSLVSAPVPQIGAPNYPPHPMTIEQTDTTVVKAPDPVPVEMLHVMPTQFQVAEIPLAPGATLAPGMLLSSRDQKVVVIDGFIPIGAMMKQMVSEKEARAKVPVERQRVVIQSIKVLRSEILSGGGQTSFVPVAATKATVPPVPVIQWGTTGDDLMPNMELLDQQFKPIVVPDFYQDVQGLPIPPPILTRELPEKVVSEIADLHAAITAGRMGAVVNPGRGGPGATASPLQGVTLPVGGVMDVTLLKGLEVVPFTFWDETVKAGHRYRYQVTVEYVNPVFGWNFGLANPALKTQPTLTSPVVTSDIVKVDSDIEFFVLNGLGGSGDRATVRVFKQSNGRWYRGDLSVQPGLRVAGRVARTDEGPNKYELVDTEFTVVDIQTVGTGDVRVVLADPQENLQTRDSLVDSRARDMQRLMEETNRPAATAPDTQPGGMGAVPVVPTAGRASPVTPVPTRGGGGAPQPTRGGGAPLPTTAPRPRGPLN